MQEEEEEMEEKEEREEREEKNDCAGAGEDARCKHVSAPDQAMKSRDWKGSWRRLHPQNSLFKPRCSSNWSSLKTRSRRSNLMRSTAVDRFRSVSHLAEDVHVLLFFVRTLTCYLSFCRLHPSFCLCFCIIVFVYALFF